MQKLIGWIRTRTGWGVVRPRWSTAEYMGLTALGVVLPLLLLWVTESLTAQYPLSRQIATVILVITSTLSIALSHFGFAAVTGFFAKNVMSLALLCVFGCIALFIRSVDNPVQWLDQNLVEIATLLAACGAVMVAIWTMILNSWVSLRNQRISVRILCIERYDAFAETRPDVTDRSEANESALMKYFRRHWAIKKDQLDFWIAGYVDPDALIGWFMSDVGYFSGSSETMPNALFVEFWEKVISKPGSVDARLSSLIEKIRTDLVPLPCPHFGCAARNECAEWQRAGLFWLLMELERAEEWSIRGRMAHGIGRETFAGLLKTCPEERRALILQAGKAIQDLRNRRRLEGLPVGQNDDAPVPLTA